MEQLGPVGAVAVAVMLLAQTIITVIFASRNRRGDVAFRWRRRMEPIHLDLLDWAYAVQMWASTRGLRSELPPLPQSLKDSNLDEEGSFTEWDLLRRRHE